jgi:hypothetical protein
LSIYNKQRQEEERAKLNTSTILEENLKSGGSKRKSKNNISKNEGSK